MGNSQSRELIDQLWMSTLQMLKIIKQLDAPPIAKQASFEDETKDLQQLDEYFQQREEDIAKLGELISSRQGLMDQLHRMKLERSDLDDGLLEKWRLAEREIQARMQKLHIERGQELKKMNQAKQTKSTYVHTYDSAGVQGAFFDRKN